MRTDPLYALPAPLPRDAFFVGPAGWLDPAALATHASVLESDPENALLRLAGDRAADGAARSRLVLIHQDLFAGQQGTERLADWLERVRALGAPLLTVLLHGNLGAGTLVTFFRAGLFDALQLPVERADWVNMLIRAEKRLERRHQNRLILAASEETRDVLQRLRRELDGDEAEAAPELAMASESLEAANRQLTDAMAELSLLYRFGRELSTARNWDRVLRELLRNLSDFVGAGGAALILRSAPGGGYSPRQTWQWDETAWDKVLVNLNDQVDAAVSESIMAPGVFRVDPRQSPGGGRRLIALPLEHQEIRLGYLLLLFADPSHREAVSRRYLPFLQAVQVVLSEEVASAQMLDRIRDIGAFNARVLETVSSAIWVVAEDGATVYCNRAAQAMLTDEKVPPAEIEALGFEIGRARRGPAPQELLGKVPELFLDGRLRLDDLPGVPLARLRDAHESGFRGEGSVRRDDGTNIPVLLQTSLMPGRQREERWLVVVAEDLRATRKLESERLRADRLESLVEMSATLAHEIRNPLMGLSAQAELLAGQLPAGDGRVRYLDVITREVERIDDTITRMLNFVRPYEPELSACPVRELVQDTVDLVRARADQRGVHLVHLPGEAPDLRADAGQLKQVLLNLLINAVDAAPEGGRVTAQVSADALVDLPGVEGGLRRAAPGAVIEVTDDGPGFRPGDLERIFRPFFTTKSNGTGLGLALCQKVVTAHGGEIRAGRRDDVTVFTVALPRDGQAAQSPRQKEETS